jgi:hypothetical protein
MVRTELPFLAIHASLRQITEIVGIDRLLQRRQHSDQVPVPDGFHNFFFGSAGGTPEFIKRQADKFAADLLVSFRQGCVRPSTRFALATTLSSPTPRGVFRTDALGEPTEKGAERCGPARRTGSRGFCMG